GFYQPMTIIKDAQRHGLKIKPIDITQSDWLCTVEPTELPVASRQSPVESPVLDCQSLSSPATNQSSRWGGRGTVRSYRLAARAPDSTNHPEGEKQAGQFPVSKHPDMQMRLGLLYVRGLRAEAGQAIVRERKNRPFSSIEDLRLRVPELRKTELRSMAEI